MISIPFFTDEQLLERFTPEQYPGQFLGLHTNVRVRARYHDLYGSLHPADLPSIQAAPNFIVETPPSILQQKPQHLPTYACLEHTVSESTLHKIETCYYKLDHAGFVFPKYLDKKFDTFLEIDTEVKIDFNFKEGEIREEGGVGGKDIEEGKILEDKDLQAPLSFLPLLPTSTVIIIALGATRGHKK